MKKVKIGIVPVSDSFSTDNPYKDEYTFVNMYIDKVTRIGALPIGILPSNGELDYNILDLCDAFIIPGGKIVNKYAYEIIYYAIKTNKPLLGICLGMQALGIFSVIYEKCDNKISLDDKDKLIEVYKELKNQFDGSLLRKLDIPNIHRKTIVNRENKDEARHEITINKASLLHDIYKVSTLNVVSLHDYTLKQVGNSFKVTATSEDGIVEALEFDSKEHFIIGVQFHPEIEEDNMIFQRLIKEAEKRLGE